MPPTLATRTSAPPWRRRWQTPCRSPRRTSKRSSERSSYWPTNADPTTLFREFAARMLTRTVSRANTSTRPRTPTLSRKDRGTEVHHRRTALVGRRASLPREGPRPGRRVARVTAPMVCCTTGSRVLEREGCHLTSGERRGRPTRQTSIWDHRNWFRGRLSTACQAKAHTLGLVEVAALDEIYRQAQAALYHTPTDLDRAGELVHEYHNALCSRRPSRMRCEQTAGCVGSCDVDGWCDVCGVRQADRTGLLDAPTLYADLALASTTVEATADPASACSRRPHRPESQRFCCNPDCGAPVARRFGESPGTAVGFCSSCGTAFSFHPALAAGDLVAGSTKWSAASRMEDSGGSIC